MSKKMKTPLKPHEARLIRAAMKWWQGRRPITWNQQDHLKQPEVNGGDALGAAVANYIKKEQEQ